MENLFQKLLTSMVIYGIFIMAVGKAAMHRSYLYPHNPTFGALSQGRARFFCAKAGAALLFQHKLCWACELRSNTPCPGSTFSYTDCLVHTNRAGGSPLTDGGFFAEPQLGVALCGTRGFAAPCGGGKRVDTKVSTLLTPTSFWDSLAQITDM